MGYVLLTPRETEVVRLVGTGQSSKQIALVLGITPKTVESYVEHARLKLNAGNRSQLMVRAALLGLWDTSKGDTSE
ncbi:response regulator transcription factor [uncultured Sphingomonas sp.]|uniref:response regulator transcription factor n=1 Tax=uncultured Sphingomonas sp. TaxID=158754 RepID=UPI0035CB75D9